ncbi:MAG: amidohydrolase [Spirochaetes bacterium]|nr:amidohydrolase [Spirochaetota bacterium]
MSDLASFVKETYGHLHGIPEIALKEFKTSAYLAGQLESFGYAVEKNVGGTGVVGVLQGDAPGPVFALRADMDALAHVVDGQEVLVHSCGHDAHSAIVLAVAKETARRGLKKGSLKILFQPAEETLAGALAMIEAGAIDDVDYLVGLHLRHIAEAKYKQATPALYHGASTMLQATIEGLSAHGARPHLGVNAIDAACLAVQTVNTIHLNPVIPATVKVTKIHGGGASINVIPDKAEIAFDLRCQENAGMEELVKRVTLAIESSAASIGAKANVHSVKGVPAAEYHQELIDIAKEAITSVLGKEGLLEPTLTPGGEDFHFFVKHKPSLKTVIVGIGADLVPGLHHPQMSFNQDALVDAVNILLKMTDKLGELK